MGGSSLRIDTSDPRPIWRQIEEGLVAGIASGHFPPGQAVPSVRELAQALRVNPATVAKAFQKLVDQGVLESRRGDGTYVADSPPSLPSSERRERLVNAAARLATVARALGADEVDARHALEEAFRRVDSQRKDGR